MYETKDNFETEVSRDTKYNVHEKSHKDIKKSHHCEMCKCEDEDNLFIILSCNHSFHINCIANQHQTDAKKSHVLDDDFFNNRKCFTCENQLDSSEIMYIHSKFSKSTVNLINNHEVQINKLERQINRLKEEMKIAIEYKQKLEFEKEKSKQIILMLNLSLN